MKERRPLLRNSKKPNPEVLLSITTSTKSPLSKLRALKIFKAVRKKLSKIKKVNKCLRFTSVELKIAGPQEVKKLNHLYRGKDKTTDVLSFPFYHGHLLGSIAIDLTTAKKQAKGFKHSLKRECEELWIHGLLHLHGFDHETKRDWIEMFKIEDDLRRWAIKN